MKYRVVIKVGYQTAFFEFETGVEACDFATAALSHSVKNEDSDKPTYVCIDVIDPEAEGEE